MSLAPIDPTNEVAVTSYLSQARDWLSRAVDETGPEQIAHAKAEIATAAEATKQLGLSKEIQLDAQEMVRRAEYALAKSIRKGQAEGTIATHGGPGRRSTAGTPTLKSPSEFASKQELSGAGHQQPGAYALADGVSGDAFDTAIDAAKAEGNLSRANVARKVREASGESATAPRRRPLPDTARDAGWDLRKSVERLQRIADDDRFATNKQQVAPLLRSHLENAVEVCQDLLARINN